MWPLAALTVFFFKEMYGPFAGPKKADRNNEVAVRRGSTVDSLGCPLDCRAGGCCFRSRGRTNTLK